MTTALDNNLGWNAGGRSKEYCEADCVASFAVPAAAHGVVIGLSTTTAFTPDYRQIAHALYCAQGQVAVCEAGALKTPPLPFSDADRFTIRRVAGQVQYLKNTTLLYTSSTPSIGTACLDATLYRAGDAVL